MEITFALATVIQSMAVSLGVGSSTFAVLNFFVAINDGQIDAVERKMMGVVYIVLRVAMGLILLTTLVQGWIIYQLIGMQYFTPLTILILTIIAILYLNAILMTLHLMPMTLGPGLQAGSWYTLGIVTAMISVSWVGFSLPQYFISYVSLVVFFTVAINLVMKYQKSKLASNK